MPNLKDVSVLLPGSYSRILSRVLFGKCARWRERLSDGRSSSHSTPVKCVNQHLLLPFLANSHSSGVNSSSNTNTQSSNSDNLVNSGSLVHREVELSEPEAEHVITLEDGRTIPLSIAFTFKRTPTPPHIAGGKRHNGGFDKFMFL